MTSNKLTCFLVMIGILRRKSTDDVSCKRHGWHMVAQEVTNFIELFDCVLSIHFIQHII